VIFLFSGTKVTPHRVFRKKEKTLVMMLFKIVGLMVWAIY
jgi:hypothetical protein